MSPTLIIVESPGKINKISDILGDNYIIVASCGHIFDLPKSKNAIDTKCFEPRYELSSDKKSIISKIECAYNKCNNVLIATDKDREGEMIAWSIAKLLNLNLSCKNRIVFTSITKNEILNAINKPCKIDLEYVNSQKARRVIDRILGYELSPLLWRMMKNKQGLSAGRVQSVVVRLLVDKENEINEYKITEPTYEMFINSNDLIMKGPIIKDKNEVIKNIKNIKLLQIKNIKISEHKSNPPPPFTTSTLQQDASRKLGFSVKKTMMCAQKLYEAGHITYMRTDSTNISNESIEQIYNYLLNEKYNFVKRTYKSHGDAHEAIRPTHFDITDVKGNDDNKLYNLIRKRTICAFMDSMIYDKICIIAITNNNLIFSASRDIIKNPGYTIIYKRENDDLIVNNKKNNKFFDGQKLEIDDLYAKQIYDKLPSRYSEAMLVNKLDPSNLNIGRPSTYATIISKIQEKGYVEIKNILGTEVNVSIIDRKGNETYDKKFIGKESNKLVPTKLGMDVTNFLIHNFPEIMDYKYTAQMEEYLDDIATGNINYFEIMNDFYNNFMAMIKKLSVKEQINNSNIIGEDSEYKYYFTESQILCKPKKGKTIFLNYDKNKNITIEYAKELLDKKLEFPKLLGKYNDTCIILNKSLNGFYISYGTTFIKLTNEVTYNDAIAIIDKKRESIIAEFKENKNTFTVINGPYGPYVRKNIGKNKPVIVKLPETLNLDRLKIEDVKDLEKQKLKRKYIKKKKDA